MNLENRGNFDSQLRNLWKKSFNDTDEWLDNYFEKVYMPECTKAVTSQGKPVSALQLVPYRFNYFDVELPVGYIMGACTEPSQRKKGLMGQLMRDSLSAAYEQGQAMVCLIPAARPLFFYYDRFDFSTVFYIDEERYTSLHTFKVKDNGEKEIEDFDEEKLYGFYHDCERRLNGRVLHSRRDFGNVMWDNRVDSGKIIAAGKEQIEAVAFTVPRGEEVVVKEIMTAESFDCEALLAIVKENYPGKDITVECRASDSAVAARLEGRGMARIVNAEMILSAVAASHPDIRQTIALSDSIISANNHIFKIEGGRVAIADDFAGRVDTELNIKTLAEVLFNTPATGELFGLPSIRPSMALMLE